MAKIDWNLVQTEMKKLQDVTYGKPNAVGWNLTMIEAAHQKLNELSHWGLVGKMTVTAQAGGKDFVLKLDANGDGEWVEKMENKVTVNLKIPDDFADKVIREFNNKWGDNLITRRRQFNTSTTKSTTKFKTKDMDKVKVWDVAYLVDEVTVTPVPNGRPVGRFDSISEDGKFCTVIQKSDPEAAKPVIGAYAYQDVNGYITADVTTKRIGTFLSGIDENGFVRILLPHNRCEIAAQLGHSKLAEIRGAAANTVICDDDYGKPVRYLTGVLDSSHNFSPTAGDVGIAVDPPEQCNCDVFNFGCTCGQMERERANP